MLPKNLAALIALVSATLAAAQTVVPAVADFSNAPVSPGSWSYQSVPGGSTARFVDTTGTARLVLQCTKATRRVSISRTTAAAGTTIFLWTSSAARSLPVRFEPNAMRVVADVAAYDALLDAIAFSRGRIAVTMTGLETLVAPAWPEAARTVEDCRI